MYQRIRDLREDKDLTQKKMSEILQCGCRAYGYYETDKRDIPSDILIKLVLYHETSIDYLLGITDIKKPYFCVK